MLYKLLVSGVSMRRCASVLNVHRKTIERRKRFLASQCRRRIAQNLPEGLTAIQFDEMETFEHTKCKPVSIYLAVASEQRRILDFKIARFPAKGKLAHIARKKYGPRIDERSKKRVEFLNNLKQMVAPEVEILTDMSPHYPSDVRKILPKAIHSTTKGRRGCVVGQGELKRGGYDPLFSLNHTAAMLRANMNRLFRRTWCTSKTIEGLENHLHIYMDYHNRFLI